MAFLCALLPLVRGAIVALTTDYVTFLDINAVDPHSGAFTKIVELDSNYLGVTVFPDANTVLLQIPLTPVWSPSICKPGRSKRANESPIY